MTFIGRHGTEGTGTLPKQRPGLDGTSQKIGCLIEKNNKPHMIEETSIKPWNGWDFCWKHRKIEQVPLSFDVIQSNAT